jgi:two-component system, response regulator
MTNNCILLVEDNEDDIALTRRAFRKNKIANDVFVARDGVEALEYLFGEGKYHDRQQFPLPAVVLLDLKLPKIDGLEVLKRLRGDTRTRALRVVVLTSSAEDQDIVKSYEYGACSYIRKPVDFDEFVLAVETLGVYWLLLNECPPLRPA